MKNAWPSLGPFPTLAIINHPSEREREEASNERARNGYLDKRREMKAVQMTTFSFLSLTDGGARRKQLGARARNGLRFRKREGGSAEIGVDVFVAAPTAVEQENVGVVGRTEGGIREGRSRFGPFPSLGRAIAMALASTPKTSRRERERERGRGG